MRYTVTVADVAPRQTAIVRGQVSPDGVAAFLGAAYEELSVTLAQQGVAPAGPPFARYDVTERGFDVEAGFPVAQPLTGTGRVVPSKLPGGRAATTLHRGPYDEVAKAYEALESWVVDNGYEPAGPPWECYLDEPDVPEPRTEVFQPCRAAHR